MEQPQLKDDRLDTDDQINHLGTERARLKEDIYGSNIYQVTENKEEA